MHDGPFELQADEIDEGRWVSAGEMDQRVSAVCPSITFKSFDKILNHRDVCP